MRIHVIITKRQIGSAVLMQQLMYFHLSSLCATLDFLFRAIAKEVVSQRWKPLRNKIVLIALPTG